MFHFQHTSYSLNHVTSFPGPPSSRAIFVRMMMMIPRSAERSHVKILRVIGGGPGNDATIDHVVVDL